MFRYRAMKVNIFEIFFIILVVGFLVSWFVLVFTWISRGLFCFRLRFTMYWRVVMNFREWRGITRSLWLVVRRSMDGYWMSFAFGNFTLCSGEYLKGKDIFMRLDVKNSCLFIRIIKEDRWVRWFMRFISLSVLVMRIVVN